MPSSLTDMPSCIESKQELRRVSRALRARIGAEERLLWDESLGNRICALPAFREADTILLYYPVKGEPNLLSVAKRTIDAGKQIAFPVCDPTTHVMRFAAVSTPDDLPPGAYGIPEPPPDSRILTKQDYSRTLCIVPALAYDKRGFRVGYGAGYYDRFLSDFDGVCVGAVYSALLYDTLPTEPTDRAVAWIITEKEVRRGYAKQDRFGNDRP